MTASLSHDIQGVIEALAEPAVIVLPNGTVAGLNRAATALLPRDGVGGPLADQLGRDATAADLFVRRCLGSSAPLIGSLSLRGSATEHVPCRGNRIALAAGPAVLLRFERSDEDRFRLLTRKLDELNQEIARRKRAEAILQEGLHERELLLRELQHRVKNNMQMLAGMLLGAAREAAIPEARTALTEAAGRFAAVSAVQQLLYDSDHPETIESETLLLSLLKGATGLSIDPLDTLVRVDRVNLPIEPAILVALILNELLTNAVKYGKPREGTQRIELAFTAQQDRFRLEVKDNGPGFDPGERQRRASGLGLVRALLRQLGGQLDVEREAGARCIATFSIKHARTAPRA